MQPQLLTDLLPDLAGQNLPKVPIAGLSADSREVQPGFLFFAIPGLHVDGSSFAFRAAQSGAVAVVAEKDIKGLPVPLIRVPHVRTALSKAASLWYGDPSGQMMVLGVTGTDGKSSTVYFTQQLLALAGASCGFFSTVAYRAEDAVVANDFRQSTLEALELNSMLQRMHNFGHTHAVIEATSHGLSHRTARLRNIHFQGGAFTNLSHEHLEFHGTFEQYASDKANLFRALETRQDGTSPCAVVNAGDPMGAYMADQARGRVLQYQAFSGAMPRSIDALDLWADSIVPGTRGVAFNLHGQGQRVLCSIPLPGSFNVENVLAALLLASDALGCSPFDLVPHLKELKSVKGRMVLIDEGQDFQVIVDYAHSPGSFAKVLPQLRASCPGKMIVVFGSGGERDTEKRPEQGRIAAGFANVIVLTNEDPRLEPELQILEDIRRGIPQDFDQSAIHLMPDRTAAVCHAISLARKGDMVLLLGKGHEQSIITGTTKVPYDEETCARNALRAQRGMTRNEP